MATATADAVSPEAPKGKGKKKLMIILFALLLLVGAGGAGAFYIMKKNVAAANGEDADEPTHAAEAPRKDHPPTYLALDPFVVNLADKESEKYAQIAVTLEVDDPKFADQMKGYMPSVRNAILLVLAHKTSQELLDRAGKDALAKEIMREAVRPMGIEIATADEAEEADDGKKKRRKRRPVEVHNPVTHVHFANFIIQ